MVWVFQTFWFFVWLGFVCFVLCVCVCLVCFSCSTLLFFNVISPTKRDHTQGQMLSDGVIYDKAIRGTEGLAGILVWRQDSHKILRLK